MKMRFTITRLKGDFYNWVKALRAIQSEILRRSEGEPVLTAGHLFSIGQQLSAPSVRIGLA